MLQFQDTALDVQVAKCACNATLLSISLKTLSLSSGRWQVNVRYAARPCKLCSAAPLCFRSFKRAIYVVVQMRCMHCYRSISPQSSQVKHVGRLYKTLLHPWQSQTQPAPLIIGRLSFTSFIKILVHHVQKSGQASLLLLQLHSGQAGWQGQSMKAPLVGTMPNLLDACSYMPQRLFFFTGQLDNFWFWIVLQSQADRSSWLLDFITKANVFF